jgi:HEAT repeat protein
VAEGVEHLWTNGDLAAALLRGTRLPGEPEGPPPFPIYLDHTYRRQSAARFLGKRAVGSAECLGPLLFVAAKDEDEDVRLACLEELCKSGWPGLEAFMVALSFDPSDEVRRLALEALGLLEAPSQLPVARRLLADRDPEICEKARAMLADESWQRWRL